MIITNFFRPPYRPHHHLTNFFHHHHLPHHHKLHSPPQLTTPPTTTSFITPTNHTVTTNFSHHHHLPHHHKLHSPPPTSLINATTNFLPFPESKKHHTRFPPLRTSSSYPHHTPAISRTLAITITLGRALICSVITLLVIAGPPQAASRLTP